VEIRTEGFGQNFFFVTSSLPDPDHVLAAADSYGEDGWQMNVVLVNIHTGEARQLVESGVFAAWSPTGHLLFTRQDTLLAVPFDADRLEMRGGPRAVLDGMWIPDPTVSAFFTVSRTGTLVYRTGGGEFKEHLALIGRDGSVEPWSDESRDFGEHLLISPDGRRVIAHVINWNEGLEEIWISDFERARLQPLVDEAGLDCGGPVWAPDSVTVYYRCFGPGDTGAVYRRNVDGSSPPEIVLARESEDTLTFPRSISPDGRVLVLSQLTPSPALVLLQVEPEVEKIATIPAGEINVLHGTHVSPDGRWVAYQSSETGRNEVYLRAFDPGGALGPRKLVSTDGGFGPIWGNTKDGAMELLYVNEGKLMAVSITSMPSLEISKPTELLDVAELRAQLLAPMRDGRFLIAQEDEPDLTGGVRINVVLNWFDELERLTATAR
jgi:serine/threonine-protein kinase